MFEITVSKMYSDKFARATASHRQVLIDHLEASAARNGFEVTWDEPGEFGDLWRDGREVATWKIEAV